MAVTLRAMTPDDYKAFSTEVRSVSSKQGNAILDDVLDSARLFGYRSERDSVTQSVNRDNMRGYIKLAYPVVNRILSMNGSLLAKILGVSSSEIKDVMDGTLVYSIDDGFLTYANQLEDDANILVGGEYIKYLIDNFDLEEALYQEAWAIISVQIKSRVVPREVGKVVHEKVENAIPIAGGFYFVLKPDIDPTTIFKRKRTAEEVQKNIETDYFGKATTRFTYLINLETKDTLYGMLNYYIAVSPPGMRPKIDNRDDPMTKAYTKLITVQQKLLADRHSMQNSTFIALYKELDAAVVEIQSAAKNLTNNQAVSAIEKLKGKQGQIRGCNLGKRIDYSARSAVVVAPYTSITKIKVPKPMLVKVYKYHLLPYLHDYNWQLGTTQKDVDAMVKILEKEGILDRVPVVLGRQPTLHRQSLQAFWAEPWDENAIGVSPLPCPAFNMDFDGDTGHVRVPLSEESIDEVSKLMLTSQNVYLAKTGECTLVPRQDMLYGLYQCTRSTYALGKSVADCDTYGVARRLVIQHKVKVWDTVTVKGKPIIAGYAAFKSCFPKPDSIEIVEVTSKTIMKYTNLLLETCNNKSFIKSTDSMVELGFRVARLYMQSLSLIREQKKVPAYDEALNNFNKDTAEIEYLYSIGMEDTETYNLEYSKHLEKLQKTMEDNIKEKLGEDTAYWQMSASGARGNKGNLIQMFSYKGRIAASATETINVVVENSYASALQPIEGMIAAYGGRKGQIDKSLKTGDTGYAMRRIWHTTQGWIITNEDCGTDDGLTLTKNDLAQFFKDKSEIEEMFAYFIEGRYEVGSNVMIDKKRAEQIAKNRNSIKIRSPLTCKNPCCAKCYGSDPSTHQLVVKGMPIGLVAAQSIGEPGTQLTMKQFQKGGVAGRGDVTSNFDRLENYISLTDLPNKLKQGKPTTYEPIAWADGNVTYEHKGHHFVVKIGDSKKTCLVPDTANLKPNVKKGEGICASERHGDYYIREIEDIMGEMEAKKYLVLQLFNLYKDECKIVLKHFETLVAAMTHYMILETDRPDLKVGQYYDRRKMLQGDLSNTRYRETLLSVNDVPTKSSRALATIEMEDIKEGIARANVLHLEDELEDPIQRIILGLPVHLGSYYPEYLAERRLL